MSLQRLRQSHVQFRAGLALLTVFAAALAGGVSPALAQKPSGRQGMMATACAATAGAACAEKAERAVTQGQPFPLVMLAGCLADLSAAGPGGPAAIDAAKTKAVACLAEAVRQGKSLPAAELLVGQANLLKQAAYKDQTDAQVVERFRTSLSGTDTTCSGIANMYTRYNCYTKRVADLAPRHP